MTGEPRVTAGANVPGVACFAENVEAAKNVEVAERVEVAEITAGTEVGDVRENPEVTLAKAGGAPLRGITALVPVITGQARPVVAALTALGAEVREANVAQIVVAPGAADAVRRLARGNVDWFAFTSSHAVGSLDTAARATGSSLAALVAATAPRCAAVGPITATALEEIGVPVDLVPAEDRSAAGLLADWPPVGDRRAVVVPHGDLAEPTLARGLLGRGWDVETFVVYQNRPGPPLEPRLAADLAAGRVDVVLLTSGSVAARLVAQATPRTAFVALGPRTASAVAKLGIEVAATSEGPDAASLVRAMAAAAGRELAEDALAAPAPSLAEDYP